ncbi:hypothetical protein ATN84_23355 [Paramesorhizobium deserti]|uniref:HTH lysR-type domain-containing protein n=1 Tax=Paramesorhizobium deserti TaxID=1494590 RepID=A0A135HY73_9HYPH|nr:LysR substrate-binding domain-containing protein [Paramesorhizobium deserti]KXF78113.1 hypothetical protein ATN84_23355 [Paramesorhizobium deserti]
MRFDFHLAQLRTLLAIADAGSFEAAAQQIGRTQSAVTQQMQKLEVLTGTKLFRQVGRRRELTAAGRTLVSYAREILSISRYALTALEQANEQGVVRIGAPQELAERLLPRILAEFAKSWPAVHVTVHVDRSPILMTMLQEGRLDMTLSTRRAEAFDGRLIANIPARWIAAPDFQWDTNMPVPLILADEPSMFRQIALAALDLHGLSYIERVTSPSLAGVRLAVYSGIGITARTESSFFSETRILGLEHGLPTLPLVSYYAYLGNADRPAHVTALFDQIVSAQLTGFA